MAKRLIDVELGVETGTSVAVRVSIVTMMLAATAAGVSFGMSVFMFDDGSTEETFIAPSRTKSAELVAFSTEDGPRYIANQILVKFSPDVDPQQVITRVSETALPTLAREVANVQESATSTDADSSNLDDNNVENTDSALLHAQQQATLAFSSKEAPNFFNIRRALGDVSVSADSSVNKPTPATGLEKIYSIEFDAKKFDALVLARAFAQQSGVEYAEPNFIANLFQTTPNDTLYNRKDSWGQGYDDLWGHKKIGLTPLGSRSGWDIEQGNTGVAIAVIDTGIDYTHLDLIDRVWMNSAEDRNNNGKVDGERFSDYGKDGLPGPKEANWHGMANPDPAKDDYDATTQPTGTEGNRRYDVGEPFNDCGLDGLCSGDPLYKGPDADGTEGNKIFDAGDLDYIDNDKNGYIDDIRGWDFAGERTNDQTDFLTATRTVNHDNDPYDWHGHGTHIAGTIASITNDGKGMAGINWNSKVMVLKAFADGSGSASTDSLAQAVVYAANNNARVISASWGLRNDSQTLHAAIRYAYEKGVVFVAAAGNNAFDALAIVPARYKEVITVAASDQNDAPTYFTNYGTTIDVAAPGGGAGTTGKEVNNILSSLSRGSVMATDGALAPYRPDATHIRIAGTSMAAPHVAGVVSLLLSHNASWSPEDVRHVLRASARDVNSTGWDVFSGFGRVDAYAALQVQQPMRARILTPLAGQTIAQSLDITGYASGQGFQSYTLEYGVGEAPNTWTQIATSTRPINGDVLHRWDMVPPLPQGTYVLRLTVKNSDGGTYQDVTLFRRNLPYHQGFPVQTNDMFIVADPTITDLDMKGDGKQEIIFSGSGRMDRDPQFTTYVLNERGEALPGWPQETGADAAFPTSVGEFISKSPGKEIGLVTVIDYVQKIYSSTGVEIPWGKSQTAGDRAVFIDTNNDSKLEFVSYNSVLSGYKSVNSFNSDGSKTFSSDTMVPKHYLKSSDLLFGNVGNDDKIDFIDAYSRIYGFNNAVTKLGIPEFEVTGLGDIDSDGQLEIVGLNGKKLYAYNGDGTPVAGVWPVPVPEYNYDVSLIATRHFPAFGDIDGDGKQEIVFPASNYIYAIRGNGEVIPGWPVQLNEIVGSPVIGDVDGDRKPEVLINQYNGNVHALHHDGSTVAGWPIFADSWLLNSPAIGDIDADGLNEVIIAGGLLDPRGMIHVFDTIGVGTEWPMGYANEGHTGAKNIPIRKDRAELTTGIPTGNPPSIILGEKQTLQLEIRNIGGIDAKNVVIRTYDGDPSAGGKRITEDIVVPLISAGSVMVQKVEVQYAMLSDEGPHKIFFVVDPGNTVPETFESNVNMLSTYVTNTILEWKEDVFSSAGLRYFDAYGKNVAWMKSLEAKLHIYNNEEKKKTEVPCTNCERIEVSSNYIAWVVTGTTKITVRDILTGIERVVPTGTKSLSQYALNNRFLAWPTEAKTIAVLDLVSDKTIFVSTAKQEVSKVFLDEAWLVWLDTKFTPTNVYSDPRFFAYNLSTGLVFEVKKNVYSLRSDDVTLENNMLYWIDYYGVNAYNFSTFVIESWPKPANITSTHTFYKGDVYWNNVKQKLNPFISSTLPIKSSQEYNGLVYHRRLNSGSFLVKSSSPNASTNGNYSVVNIVAPNHAPIISTIPDIVTTSGQQVTFTMHAVDLEGEAIRYTGTNLPPQSTLNSTTGVFTWKPLLELSAENLNGSTGAQSEVLTLTLNATDASGNARTTAVKITINPPGKQLPTDTQYTQPPDDL